MLDPTHPIPLIRDAGPQDIAAAEHIQKRVLTEDHPYPYWEHIGARDTLPLVAVIKGQVVGYVTSLLPPAPGRPRTVWGLARPYIAFLGVLPEFRNQGTAFNLLGSTRDGLRRRHITGSIWIESISHDEDSTERRLYRRFGFAPVGQQEIESLFGLSNYRGPVMRYDGP